MSDSLRTHAVDLHGSFYDAAGVAAAVEAYAELARITVQPTGAGLRVELVVLDDEVDDLMDHFLNHALHASVALQRRQADGVAG
jgi:hypothetical protein